MGDLLARILEGVLPRKLWYRKVYLRTAHWRRTREAALKRAGYRCDRCRRAGGILDVHHIIYNLWHERQTELMVWCRRCHIKHHGR